MTDINPNTAGQLKSIIERVEALEEEERQLRADKKDVYAEANSNGFDVKTLKAVVKLRRISRDERAEAEALLDTYMIALGEV